jgi:septal ring-binding cell division protein DamX
MGTMARTAVIAGTATAVSGGVQRRGMERQAQQQAAAEQQQQALVDQAAAQAAAQVAAQPAAAPAAAPAGDDMISRLKELGDMRTAGLLTDEEFATAKARLLA